MAFFGRVGGILKQTVGKQIDVSPSSANPSIFQALRWMSSSKVFIGGLSYSTDEIGLREAFAQYGNVVDARVIVDRESGRSRGFGFVSYTSSEEATSAIQALDGQDLHGRRVRVAYATDRARPYGGGGGGYGGSGYGGVAGNQGGNYSGGGGYVSGGYGGSGYGNQGRFDGGGYRGANYGGGYGGGSFSAGGYNAGGSGASTHDDAANFVPSSGAGGNVTDDKGSSDHVGDSTTSGMEVDNESTDYEPNEQLDRDEDENDDFAKRA